MAKQYLANQQIYFTDGKGVWKIDKLIRAVVLKNLETGKCVTAECIGSMVEGFEIINLPKVAAEKIRQPEAEPIEKVTGMKGHKKAAGKSSRYYGVSLFKGKWRAQVWFKGIINSLGSFKDEVEAAKEVDKFLISKGRAKRNFP